MNSDVFTLSAGIGNVSHPMHPALYERLENVHKYFPGRVGQYPPTEGYPETRRAFLRVIEASGFPTDGLNVLVTDGGSRAMSIALQLLDGDRPLLVFDPTYNPYHTKAKQFSRQTVAVTRRMQEDGSFTWPERRELEEIIEREKPSGVLVITGDNPTGQFITQERMKELGQLCVSHNMLMFSDEAYRELNKYAQTSSVWGLTDKEVPGIEGRRVSIESASKTFCFCAGHIGAFVSDNPELYEKALNIYGSDVASNAFSQRVFDMVGLLTLAELKQWFDGLRTYYYDKIIPPTVQQ